MNGQVRTYVPGNAVDGDLSTFQVQIMVTKDQPAYAGEYTRISELDP